MGLWSSALGGHTVCACHSVHGRLQSVVTGDNVSNGVHVHIAGLALEYVFKTHKRCTSGMRFVMQYHPPAPFGAHSSIISNFSLRMIPTVRCVLFSATRSLWSLSTNPSRGINSFRRVCVFALACLGSMLSPIKCPKRPCFQLQGARNT